MGYYIETGSNHNKAQYLRETTKTLPAKLGELPPVGYVPVVVINNFAFEAAGIAFDKDELEYFTMESDDRPREQLFVSRPHVIRLCPKVERVLDWP